MGDTKQSNVKQSAREAIDSLPENTTWDDVIYRMYVRQKIEEGLADVEAGRVVDTEKLRRDLGIIRKRGLNAHCDPWIAIAAGNTTRSGITNG